MCEVFMETQLNRTRANNDILCEKKKKNHTSHYGRATAAGSGYRR